MRPQHITAENSSRLAGERPGRSASMRPQHITAENGMGEALVEQWQDASMRPQHITAENADGSSASTYRRPRFNEAAAYHCGKHALPRISNDGMAASMRPQHITAENVPRPSFNEAAHGPASMRPQHITAENHAPGRPPPSGARRLQ